MERTWIKHLESRCKGKYEQIMQCAYLDHENEICSFPIFTTTGQYAGFQQYRWDKNKVKNNCPKEARYYTMVKVKSAFWGLHLWEAGKPIAICEGIFDAIATYALGYNPVAILSYANNNILQSLDLYPQEKIVISDPDLKTISLLENTRALHQYTIAICKDKDASDMHSHDLENVINNRISAKNYFNE